MLFKDQIPHVGKLNILRRGVFCFCLVSGTSGRYPFISSDSQRILLQVVHHSLPARAQQNVRWRSKNTWRQKQGAKDFPQNHPNIPSWELTCPHKKAALKMIFLFPRRDMLVAPRVYFPNISLKPTQILFYQLSRSHRSNYSFIPNTCS